MVVYIAGEGRWWYGQQVREQYIELGGGMYSRLGIVYRTDGGGIGIYSRQGVV